MSLKLVLGCMFSGKSTEIMRIINRLDTIDDKYFPHDIGCEIISCRYFFI